jgi:hypothetical protein
MQSIRGVPTSWEISKFAVMAAGHTGCALEAMKKLGFDPDVRLLEAACAKVRPTIAGLVCDFCHFATLPEADYEERWVI